MGGILLIDTYEGFEDAEGVESVASAVSAAAHLPVSWASYGHIRKGGGLFPNPHEYPVIISDALNAEANWDKEHREYALLEARHLDSWGRAMRNSRNPHGPERFPQRKHRAWPDEDEYEEAGQATARLRTAASQAPWQ